MFANLGNQIQEISIRSENFEVPKEISCFEIRERLDDLFEGDSLLEKTHQSIRRILFEHLVECEACCRSFDVRAHLGSSSRDRIF